MNQRDAQKLATRRALSAAAIRLFAERGYDETRVDDIAAAVGVTSRTFFLHFPQKDLAVFPDHLERVEFVADLLATTPLEDDPLDTLFEHVRLGVRSTIESTIRAERYRLINRIDALRHRDAINDLDYEDTFARFLTERWVGEPDATSQEGQPVEFRGRVVAAASLAAARAALSTWANDPHFDPVAGVAAALEALRPLQAKRNR